MAMRQFACFSINSAWFIRCRLFSDLIPLQPTALPLIASRAPRDRHELALPLTYDRSNAGSRRLFRRDAFTLAWTCAKRQPVLQVELSLGLRRALVASTHELMQGEGDFVGMRCAPNNDALEFESIVGNGADFYQLGFDDLWVSHSTSSMAHRGTAGGASRTGPTLARVRGGAEVSIDPHVSTSDQGKKAGRSFARRRSAIRRSTGRARVQ